MNTEIFLRFMGPAKQFHPDGKISLVLKNYATVGLLRETLVHWMTEQGLGHEMMSILNRAVFADTKKILREEDVIQSGSEYVLIPPISGG